MKILTRKIITALLATVLALSLISCGKSASGNEAVSNDNIENAEVKKEEAQAGETVPEESTSSESDEAGADETSQPAGKNGDIYVLCTSDVHCGVNQGFGYAGLVQVREDLENEGYDTFLIDNGDAIQGDTIGTLSEGETIIELMNKVGYDMAVPGNHEFDYGMDKFLELADQAEFPYISCNFNYKGELVFKPYLMKEIAGKKIAFVGISTPQTLVSSSPASFKDENGEYVYGFCQDDTGEALYEAVQKAVDSARAEGADYVYACGHLGNDAEAKPWTYADVISHTNGIDIFFDGHSHDTDQIVMKNKDGAEVTRSAMGTKMHCIAYSHISADEGIAETNIWSWPNEDSAPVLLNIQNDIRDAVDAAEKQVEEDTKTVYGKTDVDLVIFDPVEKDSSGNPIRIVRRMETNLGDFCVDAYRAQMGSDVAIANSGGFRDNIPKGEITYASLMKVNPFGNMLGMIEVTGQQIVDALEWGARAYPEESGSFLQVSGLTYEIDPSIPDPCKKNSEDAFVGIEGERRVKNVKVGDEPIDLKKTYTLAGVEFMLFENGDGYTMFDGAKVLQQGSILDIQALINHMLAQPNETVGEEYADPYGNGRITILEK